MTREQKIEALADTYADNICVRNSQEFRDTFNDYKNGVLAGIALRDAELDLKRLTRKLETYLKIYTGDKELEKMLKAIKGET